MPDGSFGERLARARQRRGLSVDQVSESLRIRPSIIRSLECADYEHMPLKGYSRNMVSSYARFLGLDPSEVTEQFLREYHVFEDRLARGMETKPIHSTDEDQVMPYIDNSGRETVQGRKRVQGPRSMWVSGDNNKLDRGYDSRSPQVQRTATTAARRRSYEGGAQVNTNRYRAAKPSLPARILGPIPGRPLLLIVILVLVLVGILVGWAVLANSCNQTSVSDVMPVTGVTSSQQPVSENEEVGEDVANITEQLEQDKRYGPFTLTVEVTQEASWLQITVDDQVLVAEVCYAGWKQEYTVNSSATVSAGAPSYVKVTRNGEDVPIGLEDLVLQVEVKPAETPAQTGTDGSSNTADGTGNNAAPNAQAGTADASGSGSSSGAGGTTGTSQEGTSGGSSDNSGASVSSGSGTTGAAGSTTTAGATGNTT